MKTIIGLWAIFVSIYAVQAQNTFQSLILDQDSQEPLIGALAQIESLSIGSTANDRGLVAIERIPDGKHVFTYSYVGYESQQLTIEFPTSLKQPYVVYLESELELETVLISATRTSRSIEDIPTRMEAITAEELGEKAAMNSANISMLLRESTGILVQQTSANSGNQSLRIQGLDGRYTQLLKDGIPLYSGFSSGLSIMQVPPLDLQQVEVIKGSASTLYGGGAIAGLVNLVSKEPILDEPEFSIMFNQTSAGGSTANAFWSQKIDKVGATFYVSGNRQLPYDPNEDGFSDIPKVRSISINPRLFWYPSENTKAWIGIMTNFEDRVGGDMKVLDGNADNLHTFSELNLSKRLSSQFNLNHTLDNESIISVKSSLSYFDRNINIPTYEFQGQQMASFSEINWSSNGSSSNWIVGANLFTDHFEEVDIQSGFIPRDYSYVTTGVFAQNNWDIDEKLILESGLRLDYNPDYGYFALPRLSLLYKPFDKLSTRIGGGLGYKLPTIFNEESEVRSFRQVLPLDIQSIDPERSIGGNFDINYKTLLTDQISFSINQLFYFTELNHSLVLKSPDIGSTFSFSNATGPIHTKGFETNMKVATGDFSLFLQYSFTDVELKYDNINNQKPLTPKHSAGATLMYEQEHKWCIGYELYYIGSQFRSDYSATREYWMMGFMALREFKHYSVFINFENFTDIRQSRYQSMITPPQSDPTFTEIWAPTDGFVANAGFIFKLFAQED